MSVLVGKNISRKSSEFVSDFLKSYEIHKGNPERIQMKTEDEE